jgi:hypothetical protein
MNLTSIPASDVWLGNFQRFEQDAILVDWAAESKAAGALGPLPESLEPHRFTPFGEEI